MTDNYRERFEEILGSEIEHAVNNEPLSPSDWWWNIRQATNALYESAPDTLPNRNSADPAGDRERYEAALIAIAALAVSAVRQSRRMVGANVAVSTAT